MYYFSNFHRLRPQCPLTFDIGDLKLRDLAKLWFFKLTMTKSNFKKSVMTKSQLRHLNNVKNFQLWVPN